MSVVKRRCVVTMAVFAAVLLPASGDAQKPPAENQQTGTQQNVAQKAGLREFGIRRPGSIASSPSSPTADTPAINSSRASVGTSSWTAGRGSFGTQDGTPGAIGGSVGKKLVVTPEGSRQANWVAGRESLAPTLQAGGIWRDTAGFSKATSIESTSELAHGATISAGSANYKGVTPAFTHKPIISPLAHAAVSRSLSGAHSGGVPLSGISSGESKGARSRTLEPATNRLATTNLRSRTSTQSYSKTNIGSLPRRSGIDSTAQTPFVFAPLNNTSAGGTINPGGAPAAPPH